VHVPEHRQQEWFHARDLEDNAVETRKLEDGQPGIRWRIMNNGELDDRGTNREHEVEVVVTLHEEAAPVRQVRDDSQYDLDVERDRDHELTNVEDLLVCRANIYVARRLEDKRSESESNPTPPDVFIEVPNMGSAWCTSTTVSPGDPSLILLIDDGSEANDVICYAAQGQRCDRTHGEALNALF